MAPPPGPLTLEECLFGPSKMPPSDIWESTILMMKQQQQQQQEEEEAKKKEEERRDDAGNHDKDTAVDNNNNNNNHSNKKEKKNDFVIQEEEEEVVSETSKKTNESDGTIVVEEEQEEEQDVPKKTTTMTKDEASSNSQQQQQQVPLVYQPNPHKPGMYTKQHSVSDVESLSQNPRAGRRLLGKHSSQTPLMTPPPLQYEHNLDDLDELLSGSSRWGRAVSEEFTKQQQQQGTTTTTTRSSELMASTAAEAEQLAAAAAGDGVPDSSSSPTIIHDPLDHVISLQPLRRLASQGVLDEEEDGHVASHHHHHHPDLLDSSHNTNDSRDRRARRSSSSYPTTTTMTMTLSLRPIAWRVLLGYLPPALKEWKTTLLQHRQTYRRLVSDVFCAPPSSSSSTSSSLLLTQEEEGTKLLSTKGHHGKRRQHHIGRMAAAAAAAVALDDEDSSNNKNKTNQEDEEEEQPGKKDLTTEEEEEEEEEEATTTLSDIKQQQQQEESEVVPDHIKEEWKRSGRDAETLEQMRSSQVLVNMNTLLVVSNNNNKNDNEDAKEEKKKKKQEDHNDSTTTTNGDAASNNNNNNNDDDDDDTTNKWQQFLDQAKLLDEIRKDVVRTHPDLYFFLEPEENLGQRRYAALERILFVWAKLNKGVRYVQGMNEIVGTIYYVLANDTREEWACEAEADTYFLFNSLMMEMRDVFVPALDQADTGIQGRISNMTALLSLHDPEVRCHLDDMGIDASFYAIRWLTTLLSREFLLPDTIRLWDSMFASTHKDNFLRYVCVTMVMLIRSQLLKGDFTTCLRLLQSYPLSKAKTNMDHLLEASRSLWIYESQITLACHKGGISLHQALLTITPPPSIVMAYGLKGGMANPDALSPPQPSFHSKKNKKIGGGNSSSGGIVGNTTTTTTNNGGGATTTTTTTTSSIKDAFAAAVATRRRGSSHRTTSPVRNTTTTTTTTTSAAANAATAAATSNSGRAPYDGRRARAFVSNARNMLGSLQSNGSKNK